MASELVQLVLKGYEAWNSGDRGWVLNHMSPEVEWITPTDDPDPATYRGYGGVEEYWAQWRAAVGQLHFEVEEMIDAGNAVVVVARRKGRGEHSGLEVSDRVVQVFEFEGDQCVRVTEYYDRDAALGGIRGERLAAESDPAAEAG
ncbi:MAG: nuclear transport factor 2 family protein [Solirubrobacterales bacterium]